MNEKTKPSEQTQQDVAEINTSLYKELRRIAAAKMRHERGNHTLQPTALVNEAYMRLAKEPGAVWKDRSRILGLAAHAMRHILVDHARARLAGKRGAGVIQITLDEGMMASESSLVDVVLVDDALTRLTEYDSRQAKVLELHYFGGLTFEEIALELGVSVRTVKNDSAMARTWLQKQLNA
jgi:RNA polymerase sigma-70 factor, ECF subfamily